MSEIADRRRGPWLGLASLAIALWLLYAIRFLTTPEGQHWVEDLFRPLGTAALVAAIIGPLLFLGVAGLTFVLAVASRLRREPFYLGEVALTVVLSVVFQIGSRRADLWDGYPSRVLIAGVLVFGASAAVRWIWRRIRKSP